MMVFPPSFFCFYIKMKFKLFYNLKSFDLFYFKIFVFCGLIYVEDFRLWKLKSLVVI